VQIANRKHFAKISSASRKEPQQIGPKGRISQCGIKKPHKDALARGSGLIKNYRFSSLHI